MTPRTTSFEHAPFRPRATMRTLSGITRHTALLVLVVALGPGSAMADPPPGPEVLDAPSSRFAWPVDPHRVLRRFDPPEVKWGSGHRGVDLGAPAGTPVTAPQDGVVTFSGIIAGRGVMTLHHPEGFDTTYEPVDDRLPRGSTVTRGERIAVLVGGHCPGGCLHWGYKVAKDTYRDPLTLVMARRPVLLPPL